MSEELVTIDDHGAYAVVTLNRPAKRNAMNRASRAALLAVLRELETGPSAIVITGSGEAFCAGMDIKEQAADREIGDQTANAEWRDVNIAIRQHPAIIIAAVNGYALGGGLTLINVCDLAIAADSALMGMPEITFATYPGLAGPSTQLSLGRKRVAWMILTGDRISGQTAEEWGIVNKCVAAADLMASAVALAKRIAAYDPSALAASKRALDIVPFSVSDWRQAFDFGELTNASIREQSDAQRGGLARFSAGEKSSGQGRQVS
jgi:enoyl-CoA hydratase/carnithine racemase